MTNLESERQKILGQLSQLEGKKIFIFGDLGIDQYVDGEVSRISPEAPVPVVEVTSTDTKLGLSGNVAANVKSLGGTPLLFSLVGEDRNGEVLESLLSEQGISAEHLIKDAKRETTAKLRVMSGQHHVVRVDYENKQAISEATLMAHKDAIAQGIESSDGVIIQDYAKGLISESACQMIMELAQKHNKKVMVDPHRSTPLKYYQGAQFMTPNRDEAFDLAKQIPRPEIWQDVDQIGAALMEATQSPQMVITLGPQGMKIFSEGEITHLPTLARKVFDVTGAGDTVIAAFSLALAAGWTIKQSGLFANMAAGVVVGQVGAVACTLEDLKNL